MAKKTFQTVEQSIPENIPLRVTTKDTSGKVVSKLIPQPITMRLDERVIEQLKLKARRLSFEKNKDITYVDLIRDSIRKQFNIEVLSDENAVVLDNGPQLVITEKPRGFWTKKDIASFNASDIGKKFVKAVETGFYQDIAMLWLEQWELWVKQRSVSHKLLHFYEKDKSESYCEFTRDIANIALVIARRKACPDSIIEAERVVVPQFEIASNPDIALAELSPHVLFSTMCATIKAWQKELDANVLRALIASAESRGVYSCPKLSQGGQDSIDGWERKKIHEPDQVKETPHLSADDLLWAVKKVAQHQIVPSAIVVHEVDYCTLHSFGCDFLDAPPLKIALESREYGSVWGIPIHVSNRIESGTIIVCASPDNIGVLIEYSAPRINFTEGKNKKSINILESGDVGIVILNDWAIAVIKVKTKEE